MKIVFPKLFFWVSLQVVFIQGFTQNPDTIYFNNHWQICEKSFATYYRIGTAMQLDSFVFYSGQVHDYYLDGVLQMDGVYSNAGYKDGMFSFYFPDGKLQAKGNFTKNQIYGSWNYYYPSGSLKAKIYYAGAENSFIVLDYFDSTGNQLTKDGSGKFEIDVKDYDGVGINSYRLNGEFANGRRDGVWKYFGIDSQNHTGYLLTKEKYENGRFRKGEFYNSDNSIVNIYTPMQLANYLFYDKFFATELFFTDKASFTKKDTSKIDISLIDSVHGNTRDTIGALKNVEVEAAFAGGEATWRKFLERNLRPDIAFENLPKKIKKLTQTVWVEFVVCTDGTVCEVKTINDVYPSLAKEAERVINLSSGHWKPAIQYGRAVKAYRKQPITFEFETN